MTRHRFYLRRFVRQRIFLNISRLKLRAPRPKKYLINPNPLIAIRQSSKSLQVSLARRFVIMKLTGGYYANFLPCRSQSYDHICHNLSSKPRQSSLPKTRPCSCNGSDGFSDNYLSDRHHFGIRSFHARRAKKVQSKSSTIKADSEKEVIEPGRV